MVFIKGHKFGKRFEKGHPPWNKGIDTGIAPWKGKTRDEETRAKISATKKGTIYDEAHHEWMGDDVGYRALHNWVERRLGKPKYCQHCKDTTKSRYHWANISGDYNRDIADWVRLCAKCHYLFDSRRD